MKPQSAKRSNLQIAADHYAASARQDLASMMADVSPEVAWTEMAGFPCAGTWIGPDQVITQVFAALNEEWADFRFTLEKLIDGGENVVGIGRYSGRHRQTGKTMQARVSHVWQLAGGRIVAFEQFTDTLLVAQTRQA